MRTLITVSAALAMTCSPIFAEDETLGTLNPDEMTWQNMLERSDRGEVSMTVCASGYMLTKSGDHTNARALFQRCAEAGYTGAMTWMSQLDNNGLGGEYNPEASAEWDRKAADLGDTVGKFNHGINLLRGQGIGQDEALGRRFIDAAAEEGLPAAQQLQSAGYDLDEVTPDADNWKYAPAF